MLDHHEVDHDNYLTKCILPEVIIAHKGKITHMISGQQSRLGPAAFTRPYTPRLLSASDHELFIWSVHLSPDGQVVIEKENSIVSYYDTIFLIKRYYR